MRISSLIVVAAAAVAAAGVVLAPAAQASVVHDEFTVPAGSLYVQVTTPTVHGYLKEFAVGYTDGYVHEDPIATSNKVREIDNYTGQAPDVQGWDGCANSSVHQHQPDQLSATDNDSAGLGGGDTPATSLHHNVTISIKPVGSGPYFLWCHYEHGPETWVKLTYADGSTVEVYWGTEGAGATYFREMFLAQGGTSPAVAVVTADE